MNIVIRETDADLTLMSNVLQISETTARVMANRGLRTKNAALSFLAPSAERLHDPMLLKDMPKALERISAAISNGEKILIYGDFDADGITSTVILFKTLRKLGADCEYYIPHRVEEGYGLNQNAAEKIAADGVNLLITVDNGISAVEEIAAANALGVETVIIDHHEPGEILPAAAAIVDPKQPDCAYPFKEMCAAGLTLKLSAALCEYVKSPLAQAEHDELLILAAIATLCDIVELTDENRILVTCGLAALNANKLINSGLGSLITMRGYLEKPIDTFTIGFVIGPCLNATGRLKSASLAVELLLATAEDSQKRISLAQELIDLNEARKTLTTQCTDACQIPEELPKVLVLTDFEAHESIAGIVAGRIRDITNRPTILLTQGDNAAKGSGRSVPGYNLFEALYKHRHLFTRFGGHAMAAGLTLPEENIDALRTALNQDCTLTEEDFIPKTEVDGELSPEEITLPLSDELARLAPFGKGNREPLFVTYNLLAEKVRVLDEKNTLIFQFATKKARPLKGIAFGLNEHFAAVSNGKTENLLLNVVYTIETNIWNGVASVQIRLKDFQVSQTTAE
ncbi:MAG: single-stranded-DNA-specific exonuclease RecJ [Defluviitaleaceae bacterium]|nr:single-stranded-DNA-specific exonuclease RecJ [Defluviitaleaceae bacterium]MCL2263069.1 single-stranded-DNA-specific exonuclease RecJ [Defluviitaleaceae bacterium]